MLASFLPAQLMDPKSIKISEKWKPCNLSFNLRLFAWRLLIFLSFHFVGRDAVVVGRYPCCFVKMEIFRCRVVQVTRVLNGIFILVLSSSPCHGWSWLFLLPKYNWMKASTSQYRIVPIVHLHIDRHQCCSRDMHTFKNYIKESWIYSLWRAKVVNGINFRPDAFDI